MARGEVFVPSVGTWVRRVGVLALFGMAGLLIQGPSLDAATRFVFPVLALMIMRSFQRVLAQRSDHYAYPSTSRRSHALGATILVLIASLPLWMLCNKLLIAITLVPALICIWFGAYLFRGT